VSTPTDPAQIIADAIDIDGWSTPGWLGDAVLSALAVAGFSVVALEQAGWVDNGGMVVPYHPADVDIAGWVPVYRVTAR
jgi:hypothetical protein